MAVENRYAAFLAEKGLYESIEISKDSLDELIALVAGEVKINMFCKECGEKRVFSMEALTYPLRENKGSFWMVKLSDQISNHRMAYVMENGPIPDEQTSNNAWRWANDHTCNEVRIMVLPFCCAMDNRHHLDFVVLTANNKMTKIGQYPSVADLAFPELKQYDKVMDTHSRRELRTALGLYAHGVGVGSYVYLRRIFERILDEAKKQAEADGTLDLSSYSNLRVNEKCMLLKDYLPDMITSNPTIYGIISKGIHELSENECKEYFPVLKECILLILQQWKQKRDELEAKHRLSSSLSKIASGFTSKE